jgi:hypothetical protein
MMIIIIIIILLLELVSEIVRGDGYVVLPILYNHSTAEMFIVLSFERRPSVRSFSSH